MKVKQVLILVLAIGVLVLTGWWLQEPASERQPAPAEAAIVAPTPEQAPQPLPAQLPLQQPHKKIERSTTISTAEIAEALRVASLIKTQIAEFYFSEGGWPNSNDVLDLPPPPSYKTNVLNRVDVVDDGEIIITFEKGVSNHGEIHLKPTANAANGDIQWRCESFDFSNIAEVAPQCVYRGVKP